MSKKPKAPKMGTVIEIYPAVPKPEWVKVGALCNVRGEAQDVFRILAVSERAVDLMNGKWNFDRWNDGYSHGRESFEKITEWKPPARSDT